MSSTHSRLPSRSVRYRGRRSNGCRDSKFLRLARERGHLCCAVPEMPLAHGDVLDDNLTGIAFSICICLQQYHQQPNYLWYIVRSINCSLQNHCATRIRPCSMDGLGYIGNLHCKLYGCLGRHAEIALRSKNYGSRTVYNLISVAGLEQDGLMSVIGYGSLLSETSSRITFPELSNFRMARLKGFRRVFAHTPPFFVRAYGPTISRNKLLMHTAGQRANKSSTRNLLTHILHLPTL